MAKRRATMFGACSLVAALAVAAGAQDALQGFDPATRIYVIQPGDTLWGVSGRAYDDPWKWPRIWENNPSIQDPHTIFPDQELVMPYIDEPSVATPPPAPAVEQLPEPAALPEPAVEPLPEPAALPEPASVPQVEPEPSADEGVELVEPGDGVDVLVDYREEQTASRLVVEAQPEPPSRFSSIYVRLGSEGLVTEEFLESDVTILGSAEERKVYGQHDEVFLSRGADAGIEVGDRFGVYELREKIEDPETEEKLGRLVVMHGWLEVVRVDRETSVAVIRESYSEIETKHSLLPLANSDAGVVVPQFNTQDVRGRVIWTLNNVRAVAAYQVLYVNLGARNGIRQGDLLGIYRDLGSRRDRKSDRDRKLPDYQIAVGVVIDVTDKVATVLVVRSSTDIAKGDEVRTLGAES